MTANNTADRAQDLSSSMGAEASSARGRSPWKIILPLAVVGALVWGGIALYPHLSGLGSSADSNGALTYTTSRNPLQVVVSADGNVESASNIDVKCRVAGGGTILWIVEDGKVVEEGEEIVKLDTSAIDDKLNSQRIVYEKALATQIQAQEDLEATKISVREYEEGTFVESLKQSEAGVQIALENLRSAENQLKYSKRMVRKGFVSSLQREADEFAVERAKLDLDAANTKKKVLVEFTKLKTLKDLEAKREAASARLRSEQAGLQLEKARLDRLQDQLKNCVITAPKKGMVVFANDSRGGSRFGGGSGQQSPVEEGAMVRESQALVRLPDLSRMLVKVTIHESRIDQVRPGLPARIIIQDQEYSGKIVSVANQPQPSSYFSANVKEYATTISVEGTTNGLKPGMTAKVTILVANLPDALTVPVSAVVEQRGQFYCWVKGAKGPERRPLKIGRTNDKLIEVVDGVKEGEDVLRNPRAMVEEARQELPFEKQSDDAKFKTTAAAEPSGGASTAAATKADSSPKGAAPATAPPLNAAATGQGPAPAATPAANLPVAGATSEPRADGVPGGAPGDPSKKSGRGSFDLMQMDKDGDKKVSREEMPERMQGMFDRMDSNADGFVDAAEAAEARRKMKSAGGGRPGGGPGGGAGADPPSGGGGPGPRPEGPGKPTE